MNDYRLLEADLSTGSPLTFTNDWPEEEDAEGAAVALLTKFCLFRLLTNFFPPSKFSLKFSMDFIISFIICFLLRLRSCERDKKLLSLQATSIFGPQSVRAGKAAHFQIFQRPLEVRAVFFDAFFNVFQVAVDFLQDVCRIRRTWVGHVQHSKKLRFGERLTCNSASRTFQWDSKLERTCTRSDLAAVYDWIALNKWDYVEGQHLYLGHTTTTNRTNSTPSISGVCSTYFRLCWMQ